MTEIFGKLQTMTATDAIVLLVAVIIYVVFKLLMLYNASKTRIISKKIESGEIEMVKKKSMDYTQSFEGTNIKPEYHYNKTNGTLEEVGKIDLQALIESHLGSCFEKVLERMLPKETEQTIAVAEYNRMRDELNEMSSVYEMANEYREKYGLSADMSNQDVFKHVESKASALRDFINTTFNGGKNNETKKDEQKSE